MLSRRSSLIAITAAAIGAGFLLGLAGWLEPNRPLEFCALILAGILISAFAAQPAASDDRATMAPSFVIEFTSLLIFGAHAAMLVAIAGALARGFADSQRPHKYIRTLMNVVTVAAATQAAGFVHQALGGTLGHFDWPFQAAPLAAAIVAYCVVKVLSAEVVRPLLTKQPIRRSWPERILVDCPIYFSGAAIAVGAVELIGHRMWEVLPVVAVPLYFTLRTYRDYVSRLDDEHRRSEVIESLDQGMCVVDGGGRVTLWNDALERIAGVSRHKALGDSLVGAVPILANTELPRAITRDAERSNGSNDRASAADACCRRAGFGCQGASGVGGLDAPVARHHRANAGRTRVEAQRRAARARGRGRERRMVGVGPPHEGVLLLGAVAGDRRITRRAGCRPSRGLARPRASRRMNALKAALKAHLSGKTPHFQHEHRIKHEDGTYRWFLCRGIAGRGTGRTAARIAGSLTDTTDYALAQQQLRSAGFRDPLTGLRNRADFVDGLGRRLEEFKRPHRGGGRFAILYLDLDRFKVVNDSLGHLVGDEMLIAVSRRLESCLREGDSLARLGGDEFAILLQTVGDEQQSQTSSPSAFRKR